MRLIDVDALIHSLNKEHETKRADISGVLVGQGILDAALIAAQQPTVEAGWIDAKKRLPETPRNTIAYIRSDAVENYPQYFITDMQWCGDVVEWVYNLNDPIPEEWTVLYWMDIPEFPEDTE